MQRTELSISSRSTQPPVTDKETQITWLLEQKQINQRPERKPRQTLDRSGGA
jgi:hypothetical protein